MYCNGRRRYWYRCHLHIRFIYSSNLLLFFCCFSWIPPGMKFTLFYLWRSHFFPLPVQWCWCWRRCCCYHYLWFLAAPRFIACFLFIAVLPPMHVHVQLIVSIVRVLFVSFFVFFILSFNAPFKSAYFYAVFSAALVWVAFFAVCMADVWRWLGGYTARQHPGRLPHRGGCECVCSFS